MLKSPCLNCPIHLAGFSKKNGPACRYCENAMGFCDALGDLSFGVPIELTYLGRDLTRPKIPAPGKNILGPWIRHITP